MDKKTLDYLMSKSGGHSRDSRDMRDMRDGGYDSRRGRGSVDFEGSMDFESGRDSRRRDRRDYRGSRDGTWDSGDREDMRDFRDMEDGHGYKLSRRDMNRWNRMFVNFDGTRGGHYGLEQIVKIAEKIDVDFEDYGEREFCVTVNMMYADYGHVLKMYAKEPEELLHACAEMAKAFLEDPDGPEPSEKLALYFHCIVDCQ